MASYPGSSRVLVISDSHLSTRTPEAISNWAAIARVAGDFQLVIHAGDLTLDGAGNVAELREARQLLDALPVPWVAVPGNHDIGDNPGSEGSVVDRARLDGWRELIGPDYWTVEIGKTTAVGIDAQLLGSGLDVEDQQWAWLQERLASQPPDRQVILVSHKPLIASEDEIASSPGYRFVPFKGRDRLLTLIDRVRCPLVVSGHVHQFRTLTVGPRRHVWAPTSWAVLPERAQRTIGSKCCGALSLELGSSDLVRLELIEPPGLLQLTLENDFPDPYHIS